MRWVVAGKTGNTMLTGIEFETAQRSGTIGSRTRRAWRTAESDGLDEFPVARSKYHHIAGSHFLRTPPTKSS